MGDFDSISHDAPFSDGISGEISLRMLFHTPVFVRAQSQSEHFYKVNGAFALPGTSVKGPIKNVLRILTSGRIGPLEKTAAHSKNPKKTEGDPDNFLPNPHKLEGDWADAIFGIIPKDDSKNSAAGLRGRAAFSHFIAEPATVRVLPPITFFPGSPKAGYVPTYWNLAANGDKESIRGWKRYKVREDGFAGNIPASANGKVTIRAIDHGAPFTGSLRFHNLRPKELGALIWTILWGSDSQFPEALKPHPTLRHQIGMNKPYGYGSCHFEIQAANLVVWPQGNLAKLEGPEASVLLQKATAAFESEMRNTSIAKANSNAWPDRPALNEVFALADSARQPTNPKELDYPKFPKAGSKENWFEPFKEQGYKLRHFTQVLNGECPPPVICKPKPSRESDSGVPMRLSDLREGDVCEGKIAAFAPDGMRAFVSFGFKDKYQDGQLHISQVENRRITTDEFRCTLPIGKKVRVRVTEIITNERGFLQVRVTLKGVNQDGL